MNLIWNIFFIAGGVVLLAAAVDALSGLVSDRRAAKKRKENAVQTLIGQVHQMFKLSAPPKIQLSVYKRQPGSRRVTKIS